ncbi:NUDIX hydrolase [Halocynthiibacter styelae]|uniref:NUDIX hydrolase n=1 Tax=Halocynthiibacter styelae TaxID=2761955 RepID=A0A8J7LPA7_9RHOB|nr:NUDIX hydrolase [Paenihalocynthiibacter styelae]MBI1492572.1 NUDIX hydrolase [Paenihalocynthiibacter styelae]
MIATKQQPIKLADGGKRSVRTQFGALCYRYHNDKLQVLLISSRGVGRWVIPKGWPMDEKTPAEASATEAFEEAGVKGKVYETCLGLYSTMREAPGDELIPCIVAIFPMKVKELLDDYPEADERSREWFTPKKAASLIDEPELAQIIRNFDPKTIL